MSTLTLKFPRNEVLNRRTYRLLELPADLAKRIESNDPDVLQSVTIRGQTNDDAVLCTKDQTYAVRAVTVSNSLLVVTGQHQDDDDFSASPIDVSNVLIRDQIHEIIELVPIVPKLGRIGVILRDNVYKEEEDIDDDDSEMEDDAAGPRSKRRKVTLAQLRGLVQASDKELEQGLKDQHILDINGELRPLSDKYLAKILTYILSTLVSSRFKHQSVPLGKLSRELLNNYNVKFQIVRQVAGWFGQIGEDETGIEVWKMDVEKVVTQAGLSVLIDHQHEAMTEGQILHFWRDLVGDTFADDVSLSLLKGNFVDTSTPQSASFNARSTTSHQVAPRYKYFPSSQLPLDPAKRFKDLFLTRPSWNIDQLEPFLVGIAIDKKERDKLLMKFTRSEPADANGVIWYYSRAKT